MSTTWFEVKVRYVKIDQDGREKKASEVYLIDAVSFTDAEARTTSEMKQIIRGEFLIDSIKRSNIIEIFTSECGEFWYKVRIAIVTIDEKAGKEKKVNNYFLVAADDMKEAQKRIEEGLSYILVPYNSISISLSPIVDVFPYVADQIPLHLKQVEEKEHSEKEMFTNSIYDDRNHEITEVDFEDD